MAGSNGESWEQYPGNSSKKCRQPCLRTIAKLCLIVSLTNRSNANPSTQVVIAFPFSGAALPSIHADGTSTSVAASRSLEMSSRICWGLQFGLVLQFGL